MIAVPRTRTRRVLGILVCGGILLSSMPLATPDAGASRKRPAAKSPLLLAMEEELNRSFKGLREKGDPPPYFVSYLVTETVRTEIAASYGALRESKSDRRRLLDVEVRVGDYHLDNTHAIRGDRFARMFAFGSRAVRIPIEDDIDAIKSALWLHTDKHYKRAVEKLIEVQTNKTVKVEAEDQSADFSREESGKFIGPPGRFELDTVAWEKRLKEYSGLFASYPEIYESRVQLSASATTKYFVSSEGSVIQHGTSHLRVGVYAETKAADGMELYRFESFDSHTSEGLPEDEQVRAAIDRIARDLRALRDAPAMEPYAGPAILAGRAAGVFFHEIFGHRVEGHRQKDEDEGQTFTKKVGESVLPDFISVYDDPTLARLGDTDLNGHYLYDDEGVQAQRVVVVEDGILKNFLMSRSPVEGFEKSNGHGRKQPGRRPVGRQGSLIVEAKETVSEAKLRELLIEECRKQGKPYGLIFEDISGGFTFTGRMIPQAFNVRPIMVHRVYVDGRPDELVRGVDLIGTPLVSFSKILACGDVTLAFNGHCGAESGFVPVSAASPSILTTQIEVQKKEKSADRPPLLPPPGGRDRS